MIYANGDRYAGQWADDVRHGTGSYVYAKSHTMCTGTFERGQLKSNAQWSYVAEHTVVEQPPIEAVGFPEDRPVAASNEDGDEPEEPEEAPAPPAPQLHTSFVPFACELVSASTSSKSNLRVTRYVNE